MKPPKAVIAPNNRTLALLGYGEIGFLEKNPTTDDPDPYPYPVPTGVAGLREADLNIGEATKPEVKAHAANGVDEIW
ncbi:unnamed protein product [[Candida] boidinii]|nr:unnamed protein product [[Candida] boidinii]